MASLFDSKAAVGLACVVAIAVGAGSVVWLRGGGSEPAAVPAAPHAGWDGPIGPGVVAAPEPAAQDGPPLTDAAGNLRIDPALHTLFDSYLAQPGGAVPLRDYLDHRLAPPARRQAADLVDAYVRYLQADNALRARVRMTRLDPSGLSDAQLTELLAWQRDREQLRTRMLGPAVAQAWFGVDDADCRIALDDWRKMRAVVGSDEVDSNELRARRRHGAVLEQGRNERAQACAQRLLAGHSGERQ
jgi:lipase chaperone LimK